MSGDPNTPPGWSYNPSDWANRVPIIVAALVGAAIAAYLAAYQLRLIESAWDPFFGAGTERILDTPISRVLPIPDALLGALAYLVDAVAGAIGGQDRWRRMPWIVILFGIAVGPLGAVSIGLVIIQPVLYNDFCTLCLATAFISVVMIGPAMDEVLATLQHVRREMRDGRGLWPAVLGADR
ncbi:MAG TPA: vitamin K epoxide reductase family protein [Candidatus Limnocylindria bacterium]|nr:vitamin K epoxide reductase family protein [Candidatus Limnocylindria bacterium]